MFLKIMTIMEKVYGIKHVTDKQSLLAQEVSDEFYSLFGDNVSVKELEEKVREANGQN